MAGSSTTARGSKEPKSLEESELLREEEEMLAVTKMLKSIDSKDSFVVAKQILKSKGPAIMPSVEASMDAEADTGYTTMIGNDNTEPVQAPETSFVSSPSGMRVTKNN